MTLTPGLIATAPELLKVLKELVDSIDQYERDDPTDALDRCADKARGVIAKAEGL